MALYHFCVATQRTGCAGQSTAISSWSECSSMTSTMASSFFFSVAAGDRIRQRSRWTSRMSCCLSSSFPFINLFMTKCPCLLALISSTRCMAFTVFCQSSLLYLSGTLRRFSNSKDGSTVNSLPAALRNAFVHLVFLGLRFFLKSLWHFDRQNLKICRSKQLVVHLPVQRWVRKSSGTTGGPIDIGRFSGFHYKTVSSALTDTMLRQINRFFFLSNFVTQFIPCHHCKAQ